MEIAEWWNIIMKKYVEVRIFIILKMRQNFYLESYNWKRKLVKMYEINEEMERKYNLIEIEKKLIEKQIWLWINFGKILQKIISNCREMRYKINKRKNYDKKKK